MRKRTTTTRRRPDPASSEIRRRLRLVVDTLGNNRVAEILGVNPSQPSRWRAGGEGVAERNQRALLDLDYVMARLHQLWLPDVASTWLDSPNAHLGGARPVAVLRERGAADVVRAIDAEEEGAYA